MSVLITGDRGFIGSHLRKLLPKADGIDLKTKGDVRRKLPKKKYSHIFHLAALRSVPLGETNSKEFIETNCWGTRNLMETYPKARILNISSSSANQVKSVYGATKLFSELMGDIHGRTLNVRLYNVFGEGQPVDSGAVVPHFMWSRLRRKRPIIYGNGEQVRDMTYVGDVVHNLVNLMFDYNITGLYHIGYSNPITINNLCRLVCDLEPIYKPERGFDINFSKCPNEMTDIKFGREEGLKKTWEWFKREHSRS